MRVCGGSKGGGAAIPQILDPRSYASGDARGFEPAGNIHGRKPAHRHDLVPARGASGDLDVRAADAEHPREEADHGVVGAAAVRRCLHLELERAVVGSDEPIGTAARLDPELQPHSVRGRHDTHGIGCNVHECLSHRGGSRPGLFASQNHAAPRAIDEGEHGIDSGWPGELATGALDRLGGGQLRTAEDPPQLLERVAAVLGEALALEAIGVRP